MQAEIIAIGDELTSGQRLDTNSQWLSHRLGEMGIRVLFHTTVGDELDAIARVFREAVQRADVIVTTGGLGPTADDLTRHGLAAAAGADLETDEAALQHIRALFARRKREMPPQNEVQAQFPAGSRVIPNPHGTAPGIDLDVPRPAGGAARVFALPGVPAEMREMWEQTVAPALLQAQGSLRRAIRHRVLKCFGVGESDLEQMLPDLVRRGRSPSVGITVHRATISLRITAEGADEADCFQQMGPTEEVIRQCLGRLVFGLEADELQDALVQLLRQRGERLSVVEDGTGGLLCDWLSVADPQAEVFAGGQVLRRGAERRLEHQQLVQLARDTARQQNVDHLLAVGPFPDSQPGRVSVALVSGEQVTDKKVVFAGHPDILRDRCAKQALDLLRHQLLQ